MSEPLPAVEVDPAAVPELAVILRAGMLGKVRILDVACDRDHRLVEVLRVAGRPLVLGVDTTIVHGSSHPPSWRWLPATAAWVPDHRGRWLALWLDVPDVVVRTASGPQVYNRFTFTCRAQHCSEVISLPWLRDQIAAGPRRVRVTNDTMR